MKTSRRILMGVLLVLLVASLSMAGTLAFLTDSQNRTNVLAFGDINIQLNGQWSQSNMQPEQTVTLANPPTVTNLGPNECYLKAELVLKSHGSSIIPVEDIQALLTLSGGSGWTAISFTDGKAVMYYTGGGNNGKMPASSTTTAMFDKVTLSQEYLEKAAAGVQLDIVVTGIQADYFGTDPGSPQAAFEIFERNQ